MSLTDPEPAPTGGCLCGAVRIEASSLRIVAGEDRVRAYRPPSGFEKLFCAACGSNLFSRNPSDPSQMSVRLGVFDEDPGVRPSWRQFVGYAAPWEPIPYDGLPRFEELKPGPYIAPPP